MNRPQILILVLAAVLAVAPVASGADLLQAQGKLTMLRVHDVGSGYGPPSDFIDVEVVIQLDSRPGMAFGFTLRNDQNSLAHQGMLSILRSAFDHGWTVVIDFYLNPGKKNGTVLRATIRK